MAIERRIPRGIRRAPLFSWDNIPPAAGNGGLAVPVDINGRTVWLESDDTIWRPQNGSAVLAMRAGNPVTFQSLTADFIETIGPFPGGLVRSGMRLVLDNSFQIPAIGTNNRIIVPRIGAQGAAYGATAGFGYIQRNDNSLNTNGFMRSYIGVVSDTTANHLASPSSGAGGVSGLADGYTITTALNAPTVDFSQPWFIGIGGLSAAETAITITGATWSAGEATYTTNAAHTLAVGDKDVVAGITPSGWNGTFVVTAVPDTTHFSVAMPVDPGAYTSGGTSSRISNVISQGYVLTLVG